LLSVRTRTAFTGALGVHLTTLATKLGLVVVSRHVRLSDVNSVNLALQSPLRCHIFSFAFCEFRCVKRFGNAFSLLAAKAAHRRNPQTKEGRMSIKSNAFGRVELTGDDAKKFRNQAAHGRAKPAAKEAVARGVAMSRSLKESGSIRLKLKPSS
jgi:hypothetical protein